MELTPQQEIELGLRVLHAVRMVCLVSGSKDIDATKSCMRQASVAFCDLIEFVDCLGQDWKRDEPGKLCN